MSFQILKALGIRATPVRLSVLDLFRSAQSALSYPAIEKQLSPVFDRVTLYRTIKTFLEKGVIHQVPDDEGALQYALCGDHCFAKGHRHDHGHVHFKCERCGRTSCLDNIDIPAVALPSGYQAAHASLLIRGACAKCSND